MKQGDMADFFLEEIARTGKTTFTEEERQDQSARFTAQRIARHALTAKPFTGWIAPEAIPAALAEIHQEWLEKQRNGWKIDRDARIAHRVELIRRAGEAVRGYRDDEPPAGYGGPR